jgi:phosphoglycolate phosphatase
MSKFKTVIFDFDYTLADSSRGAVECVNYALNGLGLPPALAEDLHKTIGLSLPDTLKSLAGEENADKSNEFSHLFIKRADEVMADLTVVFDYVLRVVERLKNEGIVLGIVSTKFRYRIEKILRRVALLEFFDVIIGGEDVLKHKPDPEGLLEAIKRLKRSRSTSLYVGDSVTDAETAKRAGVSFVAVLSGVTSRDAFRDYPTFGIAENLSEIIDLLFSNNV